MFENQFFPTPHSVVEQMLAPLEDERWSKQLGHKCFHLGETLLDPQGGKGDLLVHAHDIAKESRHQEFGSWSRRRCYAAEIDPQLRLLLADLDISVIASDWLEYDSPERFDTILSNPPFAEADKHFLQSMKFLASGGTLVQLFNAETLAILARRIASECSCT